MIKKAAFLILMTISGWGVLQSQDVNTWYFMKGIPQTYQINPAFQPDCNVFVGLPGISPLKASVSNSSLALGDVIQYDPDLDSLVFFLHPNGIREGILDVLENTNFYDTDVSISLGSLGYRKDDTYITFDVRQRIHNRFTYTDDLFKLPLLGPDSAMTFDFKGTSINVSSYLEFGVGYSYRISDIWSAGARAKILFGQASTDFEKFDFVLRTGEDIWSVDNDIVINATIPFVEFAYDEDGYVDFENTDFESGFENNIPNLILNPRNLGAGIDLGVQYKPFDWLEASASIVDLGFIRWGDSGYKIGSIAEYDFDGVEIDVDFDPDEWSEEFLDSLDGTFSKVTAEESFFTTGLPAKVFIGGAVYPHPKVSFGLLSRTEFYGGDIRQQFTFSANAQPLRMVSATVSYSIIDGYYKNLGFGLGLNAGPFNLYVLTDTGPSILFWPTEAKYANFKLGLNLAFGCRQEKKYDRPLVD